MPMPGKARPCDLLSVSSGVHAEGGGNPTEYPIKHSRSDREGYEINLKMFSVLHQLMP